MAQAKNIKGRRGGERLESTTIQRVEAEPVKIRGKQKREEERLQYKRPGPGRDRKEAVEAISKERCRKHRGGRAAGGRQGDEEREGEQTDQILERLSEAQQKTANYIKINLFINRKHLFTTEPT